MVRKVLAFAFILGLLFVALFVGDAEANFGPASFIPFEPITEPPIITIRSPVSNQTYRSCEVALAFSVEKPSAWLAHDAFRWENGSSVSVILVNITAVYYVIDMDETQELAVSDTLHNFKVATPYTIDTSPISNFDFSAKLFVQNGFHTIKVIVEGDSYYISSLAPPKIENKSMNWTSEPVNFSVGEYSSSQKIAFYVEPPSTRLLPSIGLIIASVSSFTIGVISSLMYLKSKHKKSQVAA